MDYEVTFSMCHCETVKIELDAEDIEGKSESEIKALVESLAWDEIRRECTGYEAEEIIEISLIED